MSRWVMNEADLARVLELVAASGMDGMSRADLLAAMPMPVFRMIALVRILVDAGKIVRVGDNNRWSRYLTPAHAQAKALAAARAEVQQPAQADETDDDYGPCPVPVRRSWVQAREVAPLRPAGPRSVFDLAGSAA